MYASVISYKTVCVLYDLDILANGSVNSFNFEKRTTLDNESCSNVSKKVVIISVLYSLKAAAVTYQDQLTCA